MDAEQRVLHVSALWQTAAGGSVLKSSAGPGNGFLGPMEWIDFQEQVRQPAIALVVLAVLKLLVTVTLSRVWSKGSTQRWRHCCQPDGQPLFCAVVMERHRPGGAKRYVLLTCYVSIDAAIREAVSVPMHLIAGMEQTTTTTGKKQFEASYRFFCMRCDEWTTGRSRRC